MNQPSYHPASYPPAPQQLPPGARACPWCSMPSSPSPVVQSCGGCRKRFTLSAGPALDASVVPAPFHPGAMRISLRWSIVVTYRYAHLEPPGIESGTLDPVLAVAPIDAQAIAYHDVVSIAVWRKIAWGDVIMSLLMPIPFALFFLGLAISIVGHSLGAAAVVALIGLAAGAFGAWLLRRGTVIGRRQARVVGRWATITVPLQTSVPFHNELFRRCGIVKPAMP